MSSTFGQYLQQTGMLEQLSLSRRSYTIFIPTNAALQSLGSTTDMTRMRKVGFAFRFPIAHHVSFSSDTSAVTCCSIRSATSSVARAVTTAVVAFLNRAKRACVDRCKIGRTCAATRRTCSIDKACRRSISVQDTFNLSSSSKRTEAIRLRHHRPAPTINCTIPPTRRMDTLLRPTRNTIPVSMPLLLPIRT